MYCAGLARRFPGGFVLIQQSQYDLLAVLSPIVSAETELRKQKKRAAAESHGDELIS